MRAASSYWTLYTQLLAQWNNVMNMNFDENVSVIVYDVYRHTNMLYGQRKTVWGAHGVSDSVGEKRRFLIEAAEDQLTHHQPKVEVEGGESQLVRDVALKDKEFRWSICK